MTAPVLVRAYTSGRRSSNDPQGAGIQALPPISAYAFADILRSADSPEFQSAIDGIADICAKNRMSLADEYASHLPPLGEITDTTSAAIRPQLLRPGMRRALTSVPEGSSGSSEGSHESSKKPRGIFNLRSRQPEQVPSLRRILIGSMGRSITAESTTAVTMNTNTSALSELEIVTRGHTERHEHQRRPETPGRRSSEAVAVLRRLVDLRQNAEAG